MKPYRLEKTVDGQWMVLVGGLQWGEGPRDKSGASAQTWPTRREAKEAIEYDNRQESLRRSKIPDPIVGVNWRHAWEGSI